MENQMKLLMSAFVVILIGVALIQPIADEIEQVKTRSINPLNETLTLSGVTGTIVNESLTMTNGTAHNLTGTLVNDQLLGFTEIRNTSMQDVTGACNITLISGAIACNFTGYPADLFFDYTYTGSRTGTLANTDEILSLDALRNITSENILGFCNFTISTGGLVCNNTKSATAYADYQYDTDQYVRSGSARTILTLTVLFFALFILTIGVGFTWKALKESGIIK